MGVACAHHGGQSCFLMKSGTELACTKLGQEYWVMSAREHVQEAVRIVKDLLTKEGKMLKMNHVSTPFPTSY